MQASKIKFPEEVGNSSHCDLGKSYYLAKVITEIIKPTCMHSGQQIEQGSDLLQHSGKRMGSHLPSILYKEFEQLSGTKTATKP